MATDFGIKIRGVAERLDLSPEGKAVKTIVTTYMVGEHGPFTVELEAARFTAAAAKSEMQKRAEELRQLAG